jgi:hypothetical protein
MAWYHAFNKKVNSGNSFEIEKAFYEMTETIPTAPKIKRTDQFYSTKYYTTRIKSAVDAEWALVENNVPKPSRIKLSNRITHRIYQNESEGFKERLEVERQEAHEEALAEYNMKLKELQDSPDSAKAYHEYAFDFFIHFNYQY